MKDRTRLLAIAVACAVTSLGCQTRAAEKDRPVEKATEKPTTKPGSIADRLANKKRRGREPDLAPTNARDVTGEAHDPMAAKKEAPKVDAKTYEKLMLALSDCPLEGFRVSNGCLAARELAEVVSTSQLDKDVYALGPKHIGHASEPVRVHAATLLRSPLGEGNVDLAIKASGTDKSPAVLAQLVLTLKPALKTKPEAVAALYRLASHASPMVRGEVASALLSPSSDGIAGAFERAQSIIETDADPDVRARACHELGYPVDERALATFAKLTAPATASSAPAVYAACWRGLVRMFVNQPLFLRSSEKAFDQFVALLAATPCTAKTPPWEPFNPLAQLTTPPSVKVSPWLTKKLPALHDGLARVAKCADANFIARVGAIDALDRTGASKKTMGAITAAVKRAKDDKDAARVLTKLESLGS